MLYALGSPLPEYRIKALIKEADSGNLIHEDEHARRYGFRSALVPRVSVYAYMSRSLIEFLGKDWLERGSAEVRFIRPIYEGDEVRVTGCLSSVAKDGTMCIDYQALNNQGMICAVGSAKLPSRVPIPEPPIRAYPAGHRKMGRPISLELLKIGDRLTPVRSEFTWKIHWEYCQKTIRDHHPLYQQTLHPGWLLSRANHIFASNYALPPWIHVSSSVQNYSALCREGWVETRGRIEDKYEQQGHHFVVLDIAVFCARRCLGTVRHTAIFRIAPEAA